MGSDGKERMTTTKPEYRYSEQAILNLPQARISCSLEGWVNESGSCFEVAMLI
jgi:hypothetical protein